MHQILHRNNRNPEVVARLADEGFIAVQSAKFDVLYAAQEAASNESGVK